MLFFYGRWDFWGNTKGLMIGSNVWREIYDFSPDCVLLILASDHYKESDYIRSFDEFMKKDLHV